MGSLLIILLILAVFVAVIFATTKKEGFEGNGPGYKIDIRSGPLASQQNPRTNPTYHANPLDGSSMTYGAGANYTAMSQSALNIPNQIPDGQGGFFMSSPISKTNPRIDDETSLLGLVDYCKRIGEKWNGSDIKSGTDPFRDERFDLHCGMCMTSGSLITGETFDKPTGIVVYKKDKDAAFRKKRENKYTWPRALPSVKAAVCDGQNYSDNVPYVVAIESDMLHINKIVSCSHQRSFENGCEQCVTDKNTWAYVDPSGSFMPITLVLYGEGIVDVSVDDKVFKSNIELKMTATEINLGNQPEGIKLGFAVRMNGVDQPKLYGAIKAMVPTGLPFYIGIEDVVTVDEITGGSVRIMNPLIFENIGMKLAEIVPSSANAASADIKMNVVGILPYTFVGQDQMAYSMCSGPYQNREEADYTDDPCAFPQGQGPGTYTQECIQSRIIKAGCVEQGTWYQGVGSYTTASGLPGVLSPASTLPQMDQWLKDNKDIKAEMNSMGCYGVPYGDCEIGPWTNVPGATCSAEGKLQQTRTITPAKGGGVPCAETNTTRDIDCPVNCQLSAWTEGECVRIGTGTSGTRVRTRTKVKPELNGGTCDSTTETVSCTLDPIPTPPPPSSDCVVGPWTNVPGATCSAQGKIQQTRTIVPATGNGAPCTETSTTRENECPVDCVMGEWVPGVCIRNGTSTSGTNTWTRTVSQGALNGGRPCDSTTDPRPCTLDALPVNCEQTWSDSGECLSTDGGRTYTKQQTATTVKDQVGTGTACSPSPRYVPCTPAAVNCVLGDYGDWSACDPTTGTRRRTQTTSTPARNGGACAPDTQTENCPLPCVLGEYGPWSTCDPTTATHTRTQTTITPARNGGACAPGTQTENCPLPPTKPVIVMGKEPINKQYDILRYAAGQVIDFYPAVIGSVRKAGITSDERSIIGVGFTGGDGEDVSYSVLLTNNPSVPDSTWTQTYIIDTKTSPLIPSTLEPVLDSYGIDHSIKYNPHINDIISSKNITKFAVIYDLPAIYGDSIWGSPTECSNKGHFYRMKIIASNAAGQSVSDPVTFPYRKSITHWHEVYCNPFIGAPNPYLETWGFWAQPNSFYAPSTPVQDGVYPEKCNDSMTENNPQNGACVSVPIRVRDDNSLPLPLPPYWGTPVFDAGWNISSE